MKNIFLAVVFSLACGVAQAQSIWVTRARIDQLPASGTAWTSLRNRAAASCSTPNLSNQDDGANVCVMAKALVFAKTGDVLMRDGVISALRSIANSGTYSGRALALGRELAAYVISADLIDLKTADPVLNTSFSNKIRQLRNTSTSGGPSSLVNCHEQRPNNWGTHCGASRIAVDMYLGDTTDLARAAQVFEGWLGNRSRYSGFSYGDLAWQCNPSQPVGINPLGCAKSGHSIDGVLPDDQRRAGGFSWPPPKENYVYEGLEGALAEAVLLRNAGFDPFNWQDRALLRAFQWLHNEANFTATGDDTWEPHVVNHYYATVFPAPNPSTTGKNVGYTEWTHSGTVGGPPPPPPTTDTTPPAVTMTSPTGTISGTVNLQATATDNVGVTGVQFEINGVAFGAEVRTPPYTRAWDTTTVANGAYILTATARDAAANERTSSLVTVTVNNAAPPPPSHTRTCQGSAQISGLLVNSISLTCN